MEFATGFRVREGSTLVVPDDKFVPKIQENLKVHIDKMKKLAPWKEFQDYVTFESEALKAGESGKYESLGGLKVDINFETMTVSKGGNSQPFKITQIIEHRGLKIIAIAGLLITNKLKDDFVAAFWVNSGRDFFKLIARSTEPKDVARLCSANRQLLSWCDESFYNDMLNSHFKTRYNPQKYQSAKKQFIELSLPILYAWGNNNYDIIFPGAKQMVYDPRQVNDFKSILGADVRIVQAVETASATFFLTNNGKVIMLGYVFEEDIRNEVRILQGFEKIVKLSAGINHILALNRDGAVWGYGYNSLGSLAASPFDEINPRNPYNNYLTPKPIGNLPRCISIAAGNNHSLFLVENGDVYACGPVDGWTNPDLEEKYPDVHIYKIEDLPPIKAMCAASHSLFLTVDGEVYGGGFNGHAGVAIGREIEEYDEDGELTFEVDHVPPTLIENVGDVVQIAVGSDFSLCLTSQGLVYAFGDGAPKTKSEDDDSPGLIVSLEDVVQISARGDIGMFLKEDGSVFILERRAIRQQVNFRAQKIEVGYGDFFAYV